MFKWVFKSRISGKYMTPPEGESRSLTPRQTPGISALTGVSIRSFEVKPAQSSGSVTWFLLHGLQVRSPSREEGGGSNIWDVSFQHNGRMWSWKSSFNVGSWAKNNILCTRHSAQQQPECWRIQNRCSITKDPQESWAAKANIYTIIH